MSTKESLMSKKEVFLRQDQEYMTLQALLQIVGVIPTGGAAKIYLSENPVLVNSEEENRRGRKLYPNDVVEVEGNAFVVKSHDC